MSRILGEEMFTSMPGLRPRGAVDPGNTSIGGELERTGAALYRLGEEREQKANNLELAKAKSLWLQAKVKADNAYKNDNDYKTIPDRYESDIAAARDTALGLISDDYTRALFEQDVETDMEAGRQGIEALAFAKRADVEMAGFMSSVEASREAYITGNDQARMSIAASNEKHMQALYDEGIIDATELEELRKKIGDDYLVGAINAADPKEGLNILASEAAKNLPSDTRKKIRDELKAKLVDAEAQTRADDIYGRYGEEKDQLAQARKITDADMRDEVVRRITNRNAEDRRIKQEQQIEVFDRHYKAILDGEGSARDLTAAEREILSGSHYASLLKAEAAVAKGQEIETDWTVWTKLQRMSEQEVRDVNPLDYRGSLDDTEYKDLVDRIEAAKKPSSSVYDVTAVETLKAKWERALEQIGEKPESERGQLFLKHLQREIHRVEFERSEETGKRAKVTPEEQDRIIEGLLQNTREPTFFENIFGGTAIFENIFGGTPMQFETLDEQEAALLQGIPAEEVAKLEAALRANGVPVSAESIRFYYDKANG